MMLKRIAAVSATVITGADAFFRMECPGVVGVGRIDPLVNPGAAASHCHSIAGSSGFSLASGYADIIRAPCTSCRVNADRSVYWHPTLYFQDDATKKFEIVEQTGGMLAYYLLNGKNIQAFKAGFNMIAGTTTRRNYTAGDMFAPDPPQSEWHSRGDDTQDKLAQRAVGFNCLNYDAAPEATLYRHYLPDKAFLDSKCKHGVRAELAFPSCWDGKRLTSLNHKDHVAYPNLVLAGECPASHPVSIPGILFEVILATNKFTNRKGRFVFSNGDITGLGYHGDFVSGWNPAILQDAVNKCTNPSGRIEDCPVFTQYLRTEDQARQCKMPIPSLLATEDVKGPMSALPGNVPIVLPAGSQVAPTSTLSYSPGSTLKPSSAPIPGQVFKETTTTAGVNIQTVAPSLPQGSVAPDASKGRIISTEWITVGNTISKILWEEALQYVTATEDYTTTVTVTATQTPKMRRGLRHVQNHHGHVH